jgi:uncharacterized protein YjeT (DUF2065 family)
MLHNLIQAIGLVFVIEGLLYAAAPGFTRRIVAALPKASDEQLRIAGVGGLALGVAIVAVAKFLV